MSFLILQARWILGLTLALVPGLAFAHTGHGDVSGFVHGFVHPIRGIDHVLALVSVGLLAVHLRPTFGARALILLPMAFVVMMVAGAAMAYAGVALPYVETGIALSVVVLGAAFGLSLQPPLAAAMAIVGFFALFHGHAHGAEMPLDLSGLAYGAGFVTASVGLQSLGVVAGLGLAQLSGPMSRPMSRTLSRRVWQACGGAIAFAGLGLVVGWMG